jgi:hypothetical protein
MLHAKLRSVKWRLSGARPRYVASEIVGRGPRLFIGAPLAASRDPAVITHIAVVGLAFARLSFTDNHRVSTI